jgi:hypothetical protein
VSSSNPFQLGVLEAHRDVETIENWWLCHSGIGEDGPQTGTTIGERGQARAAGSPYCLESLPDPFPDVRVALGDGAEYLPAARASRRC